MTLRLALVGCGRIAGYFHLPVLAAHQGVEITALVDASAEHLEKAARHAPRASRHTSLQSCLERGGLDAIVVRTPPATHAQLGEAGFKAGMHVYLEKPVALEEASGTRLEAAWKASGRVGMTGFNFRHHPLYRDARDRIHAGEIGQPIAVRAAFCSARRALPEWKSAKATGGGALLDLGSHHLDLIPHLLDDPPRSVAASDRSTLSEGDTVTLDIELTSGLPVQLLVSLCTGVSTNEITVHGSAGTLVVDTREALPRPSERDPGRGARLQRLARSISGLHSQHLMHRPGTEPSFAAALHAFVHACVSGEPVKPDIGDGVRCLEIISAAERSLRTGCRQSLQVHEQAAPVGVAG